MEWNTTVQQWQQLKLQWINMNQFHKHNNVEQKQPVVGGNISYAVIYIKFINIRVLPVV